MKKLTIEFLQSRHTKEILDLFRYEQIKESCRQSDYHYVEHGEVPEDVVFSEDNRYIGETYFAGGWWDASDVSIADLRRILAAREHVKNKLESRSERIARKKVGSRKGRGDR